jgi:hypothetical protein
LLASEPKKGKMDLLKITMKELLSLAGPINDSQSTVPQVKWKHTNPARTAVFLNLCCVFIKRHYLLKI